MVYLFLDTENNVIRVLPALPPHNGHVGKKFEVVEPLLAAEGWHEIGRWALREQQGHMQVAFQKRQTDEPSEAR